MSIRVRISEDIWGAYDDPERVRRWIEDFLNSGTWWLWNQSGRVQNPTGTQKPALITVNGRVPMELLLRPSEAQGCGYDLIGIMSPESWEYGEAKKVGRCLKGEQFGVLPASTHVKVGVFVGKDYARLPDHLRAPITHSWDRLTRGKDQKKVRVSDETTGFLIEGEGGAEYVSELHTALTNAGVGRTTTDEYELEKLAELCERYGKPSG